MDLEPIRKVFGLRFRVTCDSDKTKNETGLRDIC